MPVVISLNSVIEDDWIRLDDDQPIAGIERVIISVKRVRQDWDLLQKASFDLGVELEVTDFIEDLSEYLDRLKLVVLKFDVFADGRAFSQAHLLRERFGFDGIIRARGDVLRDQLAFMQRCGFNQFQLAQSEEVELALNAFSDISQNYQPQPKQSAGGRPPGTSRC